MKIRTHQEEIPEMFFILFVPIHLISILWLNSKENLFDHDNSTFIEKNIQNMQMT